LSGLERSGAGSLAEVRRANAQIARQLNRAADFAEQQSLEQLSQRDLAQKQLETLVDQELTMEQAQENLSESQDALKAAQDASTEAINKIGELLPNSIVNGLMEPLSPLEQIKASTSEMARLLGGLEKTEELASIPDIPTQEPQTESPVSGGSAALDKADEGYYYTTGNGTATYHTPGGGTHTITDPNALSILKDAYGNYPEFADGGIASGPESGFNARLHGTEAVIPLNGERIPLEVDNSEMIQELRELRTEVKQLKENQEQSQYQIAKNTKRTKDTLEQFDIDGLPPERSEV